MVTTREFGCPQPFRSRRHLSNSCLTLFPMIDSASSTLRNSASFMVARSSTVFAAHFAEQLGSREGCGTAIERQVRPSGDREIRASRAVNLGRNSTCRTVGLGLFAACEALSAWSRPIQSGSVALLACRAETVGHCAETPDHLRTRLKGSNLDSNLARRTHVPFTLDAGRRGALCNKMQAESARHRRRVVLGDAMRHPRFPLEQILTSS